MRIRNVKNKEEILDNCSFLLNNPKEYKGKFKELFNNDYLIKILDEHKNREKDNYRKIWAVYSFLKWYDEYFVKR